VLTGPAHTTAALDDVFDVGKRVFLPIMRMQECPRLELDEAGQRGGRRIPKSASAESADTDVDPRVARTGIRHVAFPRSPDTAIA
jgi:hypothetical protein